MNLGAIISALPWLRRLWKATPPPLRVPVLVVAAAVGVWYWVSGRRMMQEARQDHDEDGGDGREDRNEDRGDEQGGATL